MTDPWLGHRDLCGVQWGAACTCPCPSCGVDLDKPAPADCPQFAHKTVGRPSHEYPQYLPKGDGK